MNFDLDKIFEATEEEETAEDLLIRLDKAILAADYPDEVDFSAQYGEVVEKLWDMRHSTRLESSQLYDIAYYLVYILRDVSRAEEVLSIAAEYDAIDAVSLYHTTFSKIPNAKETRSALKLMFYMNGYRSLDQRKVDFRPEALVTEEVKKALFDFYFSALSHEGPRFVKRFKQIPFCDFDQIHIRYFDPLIKIVFWFKDFAKGEEYICCLESLLQIRLRIWDCDPRDLVNRILESDRDFFYDLGRWYLAKETPAEHLLGFHYLKHGGFGASHISGTEDNVRFLRELFDAGLKVDSHDRDFWDALCENMEFVNQKRGECLKPSVIAECRKRAAETPTD